MRFLIEKYDKKELEVIKQSLINAGIDLLSLNGGQCVQASNHIKDNFNYEIKHVLVLPHNKEGFVSLNHQVNLIDNETIIDYTASQYAKNIEVDVKDIPCPIIAKLNKDKMTYESDLFDYQIS